MDGSPKKNGVVFYVYVNDEYIAFQTIMCLTTFVTFGTYGLDNL